jgi:hypothetical protein
MVCISNSDTESQLISYTMMGTLLKSKSPAKANLERGLSKGSSCRPALLALLCIEAFLER